jgi:hypothetical protein
MLPRVRAERPEVPVIMITRTVGRRQEGRFFDLSVYNT